MKVNLQEAKKDIGIQYLFNKGKEDKNDNKYGITSEKEDLKGSFFDNANIHMTIKLPERNPKRINTENIK